MEGLNFDTRKNLIDYDSVLSNQRELVYTQRDQMLLGKENLEILKGMTNTVAHDIARLYKNPDNEVHINANKVAEIINTKVFGASIITYHFFENKTIEQGEKIIFEIL
ncbi:MAG: hypothetical protein K2L48_01105 [Mycoplasmoidaceae bacterium]|nr:hypothetical protein [Mycoplasmoidaceae bacterium]